MDMSIIIPCHNLEGYISPLLSSLKAQELGDYKVELIFVCNSCTDNTEKLIFDAPLDQYSVVITVTNFDTVGPARNAGLDRAKGEYIWFVDGDDWLLSNKAIWTILTTMKTQDEEIIRFDYEAPNFKAHGHPSMVWQYAFRRDFIGEARFPSVWSNEDLKFVGQVLCDIKYKPFFLDQKLYFYNYLRPDSLMYDRVVNKKQKDSSL